MTSLLTTGSLAALLAFASPAGAKEASPDRSPQRMEELIENAVSAKWPVDYVLFRQIGVSGFRQVNGSDGMNIAFRSNALESADGFKIGFVEYRVPPSLDRGANFLYLDVDAGVCFPLDKIKTKFDLQSVLEPPNPHNPASQRDRSERYSAEIGGTKVLFRASNDGRGCLLSMSRSK